MNSIAGTTATGRFYVWMAAICVLIAFGGFAPTYWLQLVPGTFIGPALLHVHGLLFSAWTLLLLVQARHVAQGRMAAHRAFGMAGISLATALVFTGLAATILSLNAQLAGGYGDRARAFSILPVSAITLFAGFFIAAIANIRRPEWHKRLMLLATISLLQAAMARVFFVLIAGGGPGRRPGLGPPPPLAIGIVPSLLLELLIVAGIVYDWRTRGRPHPAWLAGGAIMTAVILLRGPIGGTAAWLAIANALAHIAG
jgi:hypothetical protein